MQAANLRGEPICVACVVLQNANPRLWVFGHERLFRLVFRVFRFMVVLRSTQKLGPPSQAFLGFFSEMHFLAVRFISGAALLRRKFAVACVVSFFTVQGDFVPAVLWIPGGARQELPIRRF